MVRAIAAFILIGLAVLCLDLGIQTLTRFAPDDSPTNPLASALADTLLAPLTFVLAVPVGLGMFFWHTILGHSVPITKESGTAP